MPASKADSLAALHRACFETAWSAESFEALLSDKHIFALAAAGEDETVNAVILVREAGGEAEILTLGTCPAMRRSGLARALVREGAAEAHARGAETFFLEVSESNLAAGALYRGLGFTAVGRRAGYYGRGQAAQDALVLRAKLPLCE